MKTADLTGAALDWAVAQTGQILRAEIYQAHGLPPFVRVPVHETDDMTLFAPSTDWCTGGPIIDRERIGLMYDTTGRYAQPWGAGNNYAAARGPTALVASMRCYVASRLGHDVDVPPLPCAHAFEPYRTGSRGIGIYGQEFSSEQRKCRLCGEVQ